MIKVIDLVYYHHAEYNHPDDVLKKHAPALGFSEFVKNRLELEFVKHLNYEGREEIDGTRYSFFSGRNKFWWIPFKTHNYIRRQDPDIVIVEGLIFPLQLLFLRMRLKSNCRIIAQHHGETPFSGIKKILQKLAGRFTDLYLFTSIGNATCWIEKGIIKNSTKCREVLEASTYFTAGDKKQCRELLGIGQQNVFLWVGRLEANKDPFTVLAAFEKYAVYHSDAVLYLIYQENDLLDRVVEMIRQRKILRHSVVLIGKVDHHYLPDWFSSADFYISGSHKEGSGYALLEAMACGCIPVVTDIPSYRKITANGQYGYLFEPGNVGSLARTLYALDSLDIESMRNRIENYFQSHLSFRNIADDLCDVINHL